MTHDDEGFLTYAKSALEYWYSHRSSLRDTPPLAPPTHLSMWSRPERQSSTIWGTTDSPPLRRTSTPWRPIHTKKLCCPSPIRSASFQGCITVASAIRQFPSSA
jgi:hypothetical protein